MAHEKLLLDTNIVIDFLNEREPFFENARLLMITGKVGEFSLWISASQITDIVYILTEGGKRGRTPDVLERLRKLRSFVNVYAVGPDEIDSMLASPAPDPEDALLVEVALAMRADAIITRDKELFESELIKVFDCAEFFEWVATEQAIDYSELGV